VFIQPFKFSFQVFFSFKKFTCQKTNLSQAFFSLFSSGQFVLKGKCHFIFISRREQIENDKWSICGEDWVL
jgi:hypothetical protein